MYRSCCGGVRRYRAVWSRHRRGRLAEVSCQILEKGVVLKGTVGGAGAVSPAGSGLFDLFPGGWRSCLRRGLGAALSVPLPGDGTSGRLPALGVGSARPARGLRGGAPARSAGRDDGRRFAGAQVIHAVDRPGLAVEPDAEIALRQAGQGTAVAVAHLDVEERQRDSGRLGELGQAGQFGDGWAGLLLARRARPQDEGEPDRHGADHQGPGQGAAREGGNRRPDRRGRGPAPIPGGLPPAAAIARFLSHGAFRGFRRPGDGLLILRRKPGQVHPAPPPAAHRQQSPRHHVHFGSRCPSTSPCSIR